MNPSRWRRARAERERCRCAQCSAGSGGAGGTDPDPEACMRAVAEDIRAVGWSVSAVPCDGLLPPWAYTVGLWLSRQVPELALFGLPVEDLTVIVDSVAERAAGGMALQAGDEIRGICPCPLAVRPVHASWRETSLFAVSDRYYRHARPPCLQVAWPDRKGRYPGDPGFQPRYEGRQPMLWLPRDDNPPSAWTRLGQLS